MSRIVIEGVLVVYLYHYYILGVVETNAPPELLREGVQLGKGVHCGMQEVRDVVHL